MSSPKKSENTATTALEPDNKKNLQSDINVPMDNDPLSDNENRKKSESNWLSNPLNLLLISALIIVVACFLPWIEATALFMSLSRTGTQTGDGKIVLICGIIIAFVALRGKAKNKSHLSGIAFASTIICALLCALASIYNLVDVLSTTNDVTANSEGLVIASTGSGLWIASIGSIAALWFTIRAFIARKKAEE